MHVGRPWRTVVHIDEQPPGPRGGEAWCLLLDCGHHAFRPIPHPDPVRALANIGLTRRVLRGAPHRVRCLWCDQ